MLNYYMLLGHTLAKSYIYVCVCVCDSEHMNIYMKYEHIEMCVCEQLQCLGFETESLRGEQVRLLRIPRISLLCVRKSFIVHNYG